jgi:signal transduction histidine kinase
MGNLAFGILIAFLFISLVVLALVILLKLYLKKVTTHSQIIHEKELEHQKVLSQSILETQEETLNNIAMELHDDTGQQLTYINLQLENLKLSHPELNDTLSPVSESMQHMAKSVRKLSHYINAQNIKEQPLVKSLQIEIERLNELKQVVCNLNIQPEFSYQFSENERIVIYRIFQEVTNNMLKHAQANQYTIQISHTPKLSFIFKDDGIGFDPKIINDTTTHGICNMKKRAEMIDYTFQIDSEKDTGTAITLTKNKHV